MTYLASILSDKFVNAFVATCTSQQLALEMQFYLDFHQVYTTMTANADQRKWRQIRIFADKRKWRKIRISTEQRKWRKIRISAVSVHILRIQQYRTIRATRGSCSYREGIISILCRCHFQFSSAERKYIFLVIPRRGILLWTSFSRVQRKERKSRETKESNWSPFSGGEKIHSCTVKLRDDVVVPLDSCCSFTTHRDEFPIIPAIQTYTSHHTYAVRCAHISFASNCRQDFSWHGCKTTTVVSLPLQFCREPFDVKVSEQLTTLEWGTGPREFSG